MKLKDNISTDDQLIGVMFNAYPDSIGSKLSDTIAMLQKPEFKDVFSFFYVLPTFFNSDLDRGFSIIDYNLNNELVSQKDLEDLKALGINLKFDIVLNHLSVASPQFKDLLKHGERSKFKDFFISWNDFWKGNGEMNEAGVLIPKDELLDKLFMRKSGMPILNVPFPDGSKHPYWNTFYQKVTYNKINSEDLKEISELSPTEKEAIVSKVNMAVENGIDIDAVGFNQGDAITSKVLNIVDRKCTYLGQMDVNAKSPLVWRFYEDTLSKLSDYGCEILRLDAFAYLHKEVGESNFFNVPGTWDYLDRIASIAGLNNLQLLPEIHAEYGLGLHKEVADKGYKIYDFFLPGLMIHTLEKADNKPLLKWINEIFENDYKTVNMLGCHDGIPVLDLKGKEVNGEYRSGLLKDNEIEDIMDVIIQRGGRVKNLFGPSGEKISYYQINATYFSALGESEQKLLLARAIQMFMPGIPQVWYLDLFAGKNDYEAADKGGSGGHKEINRTNLTASDVNSQLNAEVVTRQLEIIRFRNTSKSFLGEMTINDSPQNCLDFTWVNGTSVSNLKANLKSYKFEITSIESGIRKFII
ncbi:glycosidase [Winogradskyella sp. A3E31]|uniref:glycosidase n=1 Tax=Winogradskyella sp. A3E31 TaxID=3349637 RepID=UPI00398B06A2